MKYEQLTHFTEVFTEDFVAGEWKTGSIPYIQYENEVLDFINLVNHFEEPHSIQVLAGMGYDGSQLNVDKLNIQPTNVHEVLAMLTCIVRTERNMPGVLKKAVECGTVVRLLSRLSVLELTQAS